MAAYIVVNGERMLLDTKKSVLDYEGRRLDLTGATLALYDAEWSVVDGTVGKDATPCKVMVWVDPFTGLRVEVPVPYEVADRVATGLRARVGKRARRLLRTH